jgi:hypothetical protein
VSRPVRRHTSTPLSLAERRLLRLLAVAAVLGLLLVTEPGLALLGLGCWLAWWLTVRAQEARRERDVREAAYWQDVQAEAARRRQRRGQR